LFWYVRVTGLLLVGIFYGVLIGFFLGFLEIEQYLI
jgi:hypothetical protein